jgi:hypothetical protein
MRAFFGLFRFFDGIDGFWLARFESCGWARRRPLSKVEMGLWMAGFAL